VNPEEEVGDVGVDKVAWIATGHFNGSVRIWDLETERCATTFCTQRWMIPNILILAVFPWLQTGVAL
jgi:hypothetical protein